MASNLVRLSLCLVYLAALGSGDTTVGVPVNRGVVPVTDVGTTPPSPTSSSSTGGDPTVTNTGETFTGNEAGGTLAFNTGEDPSESASLDPAATQQAVAEENDPVGDVQHDEDRFIGKRRQLLGGRKMLGALELGSTNPGSPAVDAAEPGVDGVPGSSAEVGATASGHGDLDGPPTDLSDNHIEPHGVDGTVTAAGESTTASAGVNPDCSGTIAGFNEGEACTTANVGK